MTSHQLARHFLFATAPGVWHMGLDEALLETILQAELAGARPLPILRCYSWSEATISLGYFQRYADLPEALRSLPCVRRLTGGGAILHHFDWTYSLVYPSHAWPHPDFTRLVQDVHELIAELLTELLPVGTQPSLHPKPVHRPEVEPFLCFARRSPNDLVARVEDKSWKLLGSAQCKRRGALLQHGSILIAQSPYTSHLAGLDAWATDLDTNAFSQQFAERLAQRWQWQWRADLPTESEHALAERLAQEKYGATIWTQRR